ncbi:MAG: hypothetical protein ACRDPG_09355 [Nocardioidaceae bacterium]
MEASPASWHVLCPADATVFDARDGAAPLRGRPVGCRVVVVDGRWGSRRRLRRLAQDAGVAISRELVLLPGRNAPAAVIDDSPDAVRLFWATVEASPGLRHPRATSLLAAVAGRLPWFWTGVAAPGRVLIGTRL